MNDRLRFHPFTLDTRQLTLSRFGSPVDLSPRLVEILAYLASRPGDVVSRQELLDRFWAGIHVTDNTVTRAVADIRKALEDRADPAQVIQTAARRGYRFVAAIDNDQPRVSGWGVHDAEDPYAAWVRGRVVLESLDATHVTEAVQAFEVALRAAPTYAPTHAGLASAYFLQYERTRVENVPDRCRLDHAIAHARQATTLDPELGEAWATLGFALAAAGHVLEARAAARHGVALEPLSWRHQYRLAVTTWGEERLHAIDRVLALVRHFPAAYFLAAMVHVARHSLSTALQLAQQGAKAQGEQSETQGAPFPVSGLHWLTGLVQLGLGAEEEALAAFARELQQAQPEHVYRREILVHTLVAKAFVHLGRHEPDLAQDALGASLELVPGHARTRLGLAIADWKIEGETTAHARRCREDVALLVAELRLGRKHQEAELVQAAADGWLGDVQSSCSRLQQLTEGSTPGPIGWDVHVDPMLAPSRTGSAFAQVLARVAARAA